MCVSLQAVLTDHTAEVVGVALHPTNKYFITASADKSWAFYDLDSMLCMAQVQISGTVSISLLFSSFFCRSQLCYIDLLHELSLKLY